MPRLEMLMGLPGSGKDYYAKNLTGVIISSDNIRQELFNDVNDQSHNNEVFEEMCRRTITTLKRGGNVIYNATNLVAKRRKHFLSRVAAARIENLVIVGTLIATPIEQCKINNSSRERKVPEEVIERMIRAFQTPRIEEGFDDINLIFPYRDTHLYEDSYLYSIDEILEKNAIPHDNPHHKFDIDTHMRLAWYYLYYTGEKDELLKEVGLLHDIGKFYVKSFKNSKGEKTDIAHYYSHNNVGAYLSLFVETEKQTTGDGTLYLINQDLLTRAALIGAHMDLYNFNEKLPKEKKIEKLMKKYNNLHFVECLLKINLADRDSH